MSGRRAMAYLDGGPADGQVVRLDEPEWAPISVIRVAIDGVEVVYVRAVGEPQAPDGTWRYVPEDSADSYSQDATSLVDDPFDE